MPDPLHWLFGLEQFGIKLGLDTIHAILDALGRPDRAFRSIHVGGTNGKGSVTAMIDAALRADGRRAARYTSPHLVDLSERFVIDGRPIDRPALVRAVSDLRDAVAALHRDGTLDVQPTFFEVTTAAAFELFRRAGVDIAVCEVGLGGRLDATNVLRPLVSVITSIGLDHQQHLGNSLEQIALEKAGIIKPGIPVVVGRMNAAAHAAIAAVARERGSAVITASGDEPSREIALRGRHQADNAHVAVAALHALAREGVPVSEAAIARGLATVVWPGRLDVRQLPDGREALLDAAHNPDGARALAAFLPTSPFADCPLVFGAMRDKDADGMLAALAPVVGSIIITRVANARAADPAELLSRLAAIAPRLTASVSATPAEAVTDGWKESRRIVVAGSIFLLGDVMKAFGWT